LKTVWVGRVAPCLFLLLVTMTFAVHADDAAFFPPKTPVRPVVDVLHGTTLTDGYRWLENGQDPAVTAWTRDQHAATLRFLDAHAAPSPGVKEELGRYFDRDRTEPPLFKNGREFFQRATRGRPQAALYTRVDGRDVLLLDPVVLDPSGKTRIGAVIPNREATRVAVGVYAQGTERKDFRILDSTTGEEIGPVITGLDAFAWARDERYAFITPRTAESDAKQLPMRCLRHRLGGDRNDDELLLTVPDAKDYCAVYEPEDTDVTVFETGDFWSNTIRIRKTGSPDEPRTIYSSREFRADATFRRDRIYIRTNDHAPKWKLMAATYDKPSFGDWTTLVAEQANVLDAVTVTSTWIVATIREDVLAKLVAYDLRGVRAKDLPLPEFGSVTNMAYDLAADRAYATVASYTSPYKEYGLDGKALAWSLVWQDEPPLDLSAIVAERVYVPARDGAKIPVFVVHRRDMAKGGTNPTLLHVYGGFDVSVTPFYLGSYSAFVNRGGVYVEAGVRGGGEYGEKWHEAAMLAHKQTTFDDTIDVAEWLVREGYTNPGRLAVEGGSNGGLTVGAVITQRPDLFRAAICDVPLLDMIRYHRFLIARYWIPEYGDPDQDADFRWLLRYSPYQNVKSGVNLPETLVIAGEYDSRVDPMHAKKFVALVQNHPGQVSPFLLYMDFDSGHGTGKTQQQRVIDRDYVLRFLMRALGMS
jgi:prolyl oligopeptidase